MSAVAQGTVGRTILLAALSGGALAAAASTWFGSSRVPAGSLTQWALIFLGILLAIAGLLLAWRAFENFRNRRLRLAAVPERL